MQETLNFKHIMHLMTYILELLLSINDVCNQAHNHNVADDRLIVYLHSLMQQLSESADMNER